MRSLLTLSKNLALLTNGGFTMRRLSGFAVATFINIPICIGISPASAEGEKIESTYALPSQFAIYGVTVRSTEGKANGFYVTCDSNEIIIGTFCESLGVNAENGEPNALLTAGSATRRSGACLWKNNGDYKVSASCLSIAPVLGDSGVGIYVLKQPLQ